MKTNCLLAILIMLFGSSIAIAQEKKSVLLDVSYHAENNTYPYIIVFAKSKVEKKFLPAANLKANMYIGEIGENNLLGSGITNRDGKTFVFLPPSVKSIWDSSSTIVFKAVTEESKTYEAGEGETTITKTKITLDTLNNEGIQSIVAKVEAKNGNTWVPVPNAELKVVVKRSIGNLSAGDAENYTTDSAGVVTVEFKKAGIPGDEKGNIVIVAKMEENETYGNVTAEKTVPWGNGLKLLNNDFNRRTLFATGDKAPLWLLLLAGSIIVTVWSVIVYLVMQIIKMRKLGKNMA